ncbi:MAG TPA: hypothetical protein PKE55_11430 [Kiritimatiellia bacterium]|nr:hypothetical protein [Kiritimatiellia bacterium]
MLTSAQRRKFFPAMQAAWVEHCAQNGLHDNAEQKDAWYRDEMAQVCEQSGLGKDIRSIRDLDHVAGYDAVMLHWAIIAGNDVAMGYFSTAVERRYRKLIKDALRSIGDLENTRLPWSYVKGVCAQMQIPDTLEDCPASLLAPVFMALDTHRRRILASRGQLETRKPGLGSKRWDREYHVRRAKDL